MAFHFCCRNILHTGGRTFARQEVGLSRLTVEVRYPATPAGRVAIREFSYVEDAILNMTGFGCQKRPVATEPLQAAQNEIA